MQRGVQFKKGGTQMSNGSWFEYRFFKNRARWKNGKFPKFVQFDEAVEMAIFKQPMDWDPLHPSYCFGALMLREVRSALQKALEGRCGEYLKVQIIKNTGLYSAINTAADYWHATDAIICCDLGHVAPIVTIDLKARPDDGQDIREDHIILTDRHFYQKASNHKLRFQNLAGVIADQLISKLEELGVLSPAPVH